MTDEFDLDPMERELRRRFDQLGATDDPDTVLDALRPRLRRAQRTHRIVTAAAATMVVIAAVVVGLAAFRGSDTGSVRITPPASNSPSVSTTTPPPADPATPTVSTPDDPGQTGTVPIGGTLPDSSGTSTPTSSPAVGITPEAAPEPTTTPVSSDTPYSSAGGSIVVHRSGSTISLGSSTPATGYTQEVHDNGPTRVEVRFNNGQTEWRIRVDLVNGELEPEITQH